MIPLCPLCLCGESLFHKTTHRTDRRNRTAIAGVIFMLVLLLSSSLSHAQGQSSRYINPPSLVKPNGYTHVVVAPDGRTVYVAGQVALDSTGQLIGAGDFQAQAEQVFQNLRRALASVGGSLDDVVKTTTFVTDPKHVPVLRELRPKFLGSAHPPANTLVVVSALARAGLLIEVEAVAVMAKVVRFTGAH
jgi:enamine deaminase RidA (YjgF/YER057c/UK114 family)